MESAVLFATHTNAGINSLCDRDIIPNSMLQSGYARDKDVGRYQRSSGIAFVTRYVQVCIRRLGSLFSLERREPGKIVDMARSLTPVT